MDVGAPQTFAHLASPYSFDETVKRIRAAIEAGGLAILADIDHAEGANKAGLSMPPTLVLTYGNPRGGTPVMLAYPDAALQLPLRVLIREEAHGAVVVVFQPVVETLRAAGVPRDAAEGLSPGQDIISRALAAQP